MDQINKIKQSATYSHKRRINALQAKIMLIALSFMLLLALYAFHTLFIRFIELYN